jgi:hypothetical protein
LSQYTNTQRGASGRARSIPVSALRNQLRFRRPTFLEMEAEAEASASADQVATAAGQIEARCVKCGRCLGLCQPNEETPKRLIGYCLNRRCGAFHMVDATPLRRGEPANVLLLPDSFWDQSAAA